MSPTWRLPPPPSGCDVPFTTHADSSGWIMWCVMTFARWTYGGVAHCRNEGPATTEDVACMKDRCLLLLPDLRQWRPERILLLLDLRLWTDASSSFFYIYDFGTTPPPHSSRSTDLDLVGLVHGCETEY
ncbi:hypothetical protein SESBI_49825 [Sesbania bispinosa]|nr:hypothetical protein SESBI_49825 [Sesbania bispinosa]